MDGFAYAGEALTGRYYGAKEGQNLRSMLRSLFMIGATLAPLVSLVYFFGGLDLLSLLSDKPEVLTKAMEHHLWAVLIPIVSFMAFLWDGVFVGMTTSRPMVQAVFVAWIMFYLSYFALNGYLGEDALWIAFVLYLGVRSLFSAYCGVRLVASVD